MVPFHSMKELAMQRKMNLVAVGMTALFLTACSSNPSKQDIGTVTGAVVGGVVGSSLTYGSTAGTVAGAVAGGYVGRVVGREMERK
jgi:osmotically inducible lipoprotein OsmB